MIDYEAFQKEIAAVSEEIEAATIKFEQICEKYGMSSHMDGPAYGMGGFYEPKSSMSAEDTETDTRYYETYGEKSVTGGYWLASSASC